MRAGVVLGRTGGIVANTVRSTSPSLLWSASPSALSLDFCSSPQVSSFS